MLQQTERDKSPARLTETPPDRSADPTPMSLMTGDGIKSLGEWHHYDKFPDLLYQQRGPLRFGRTGFLVSGTVIFSPSGQRLSKHLPFEHRVTNVYRKLHTQCPLPVSGKGECPGQVSVRYNEIDGGIVKFIPNYLLLPTYFKPQKQKRHSKGTITKFMEE